MSRRALLLSGGIDSLCIAYWKRPAIAVTIDYGQKAARGEIQASHEICRTLGIEHLPLHIDCSVIGSGDMSGNPAISVAPVSEWWPFRNQLLVTLAASALLSRGVSTLIVGAVKSDSQHADGRPEFFNAISKLLALQEGGLTLEAPAISFESAELVRVSGVPIEILAWAHSCHTSHLACGRCRGCAKHFDTMKELGIGPY